MQSAHKPKKQLGAVGVDRQPEGRMGTASGQHVAHSGALQEKLGQLVDNLVFPLKNAITLQPCNAPLIAHPLSMLRCSHCHTDLCHGQCGRRREREMSITGRSTSIVPERSARPSLQRNNLNEKSIMASCVPGKGPDATPTTPTSLPGASLHSDSQ